MSTLYGLLFLIAGLVMIVCNRWIAHRGIEFQASVGSIWSGRKSFVAMRVLGMILGVYAAIVGILIIVGKISL